MASILRCDLCGEDEDQGHRPENWYYVEHEDIGYDFCSVDCALAFLADRVVTGED